jgi:uncharacterized protein (UPF0276 family)
MKPLLGLSLMHEQEFLQASLPLFLNEEVDVIEWSFDTIPYEKDKPQWLHQLLTEYSQNQRLLGHGVRYSLFDAKWTNRQDTWIKGLQKEVKKYNYNHITEHFGFMSNSNFHKGAPLPVPFDKRSLAIGTDRLKRLHYHSQLPVGVENLAFAFSKDEIKKQGEFLNKLVQPVNGFLILDLHNIYCQAKNFKTPLLELVRSYPLDKVQEIHISGGSWEKTVYSKRPKRIRRDTHDEKVPSEIFRVLPEVLKLCRNARYVIFERLGHTLADEKERKNFRSDFRRLRKIISETNTTFTTPSRRPKKNNFIAELPLFDPELFSEQQSILKIMRRSGSLPEIIHQLQKMSLKRWNIQAWNTDMLETAIQLLKKWD